MTHDEAWRAGFSGRALPTGASASARASWRIGRARAQALPVHDVEGGGDFRSHDPGEPEVCARLASIETQTEALESSWWTR